MADRNITADAKRKLWIAAAGRCQYPGCPKLLWRDDVTYRKLNTAHIAHIEAVKKGWARYNKNLGKDELNSFSNLMLLCYTHHHMIDHVDENGTEPHIHHPVDLLKKFKKEHEERIEFMTSLSSQRSSYPMLLKCNIERYKINFDLDDIREAMLPDRRPKTPQTIDIDLTRSLLTEEEEGFWEKNAWEIKEQLKYRLNQGPDGEEINHLSIFALGPMPLLIYFGFCLGDIIDSNVYQKHRIGGWKWQVDDDAEEFNYTLEYPESLNDNDEVVVELSVSGKISETQYPISLKNLPRFIFKSDKPSVYFLSTFERLELFKKEIRELLKMIREEHPSIETIHLLPAIPVPIAVEFGRAYQSKIDPKIIIYNPCDNEFKPAIEIN